MVFSTIFFSYILVVSFIDGRYWSTQRKPVTDKFIT